MVEIDDRWDAGDYGDSMDDANRASYERRKERERTRYQEACGKLQELAEFDLVVRSGTEQFLRLRERWPLLADDPEVAVTFRREVVLTLIERVDLNMETGSWNATTKVRLESFRRLSGVAVLLPKTRNCSERSRLLEIGCTP